MNVFEIEREIFTKVATAVLAVSPSCHITNSLIYAPSVFPHASIVMSDDGTTEGMRDSSNTDNFNDVTLTADVFSNKTDGKKTEAEAIMQTIIDTLFSLNFKKVSCRPSSGLNNATIYKLTATFTATVGADGSLYTRK